LAAVLSIAALSSCAGSWWFSSCYLGAGAGQFGGTSLKQVKHLWCSTRLSAEGALPLPPSCSDGGPSEMILTRSTSRPRGGGGRGSVVGDPRYRFARQVKRGDIAGCVVALKSPGSGRSRSRTHAGMDLTSRQRYLEAARHRHAATDSRAGASWAILGHCDACKMLSRTSYAITSYALTLCFRR
jgi:hypothetical protein